MARSRIIKPGFFKNEDLGALSPLARLLWAGIWTIADRDGRLEDRPRKIRAEVLPYDDCDGEELVAALAVAGFLLRYEAGGVRYLQVVNWKAHQQPHVKEQASTIPAPGEQETTHTDAPDMSGASTVQAPDIHETCTEDAPLVTSYSSPVTRSSSRSIQSRDQGIRREGARASAAAPPNPAQAMPLSEADYAEAAKHGLSREDAEHERDQWFLSRTGKGATVVDRRADLWFWFGKSRQFPPRAGPNGRQPKSFAAIKIDESIQGLAEFNAWEDAKEQENGTAHLQSANGAPLDRLRPGTDAPVPVNVLGSGEEPPRRPVHQNGRSPH